MTNYHSGHIIRYANPEPGEESLTFTVIEDNGDRILIESRDFTDWRFAPRETVATAEIACVDCGMPHTAEHACEPIGWTYDA